MYLPCTSVSRVFRRTLRSGGLIGLKVDLDVKVLKAETFEGKKVDVGGSGVDFLTILRKIRAVVGRCHLLFEILPGGY